MNKAGSMVSGEQMVTIQIPPLRDGDEALSVVDVIVNGKQIEIQRGVMMQVSIPVFEALKRTGKYGL